MGSSCSVGSIASVASVAPAPVIGEINWRGLSPPDFRPDSEENETETTHESRLQHILHVLADDSVKNSAT
jgi:hypothetical protein